MKQIYANNQTTIQLGRQGENLARQVIFDLADWIEDYGEGVVELIVRRPGDEKPYPVAVTRKGSNAVWTLTAADMAVKTSFNNCGQCELRWYVGEILAKSYIWRTCVDPAMDTPAETAPPAPEQGWVDQVAATGAAAKAAAKAAKAEADRASDMADDVVRSIGEAGSCVVKQVQDATSEGVKAIRDAGSEERSSLENAGDAQVERIKDEGETQTANAKAQSDAAALSATGAAQSAQQAAESAAVYDNVVTDITQLEEDVAAITPDDAAVNGKPWTSKKTVDSLCMPFEESGNPVQVYPVENYPLGVKVSWEPTQEGEGDPSPENIRQISGRDAVQVTRCGKNLSETNAFGGITWASQNKSIDKLVNSLPAGTYKISFTITLNEFSDRFTSETAEAKGLYAYYTVYDGSASYGRQHLLGDMQSIYRTDMLPKSANVSANIVIAEKDTGYKKTINFYGCGRNTYADGAPNGALGTAEVSNLQIELGSTATPYELYTGSTTGIALPETVYGGTLDVESGVVTVEYGHISSYAGEALPGDWISDRDVYSAGAVPTTGAQVVYKLAEPITIQLSPKQIAALSGVNTLYTDADGVVVTGAEDPKHTITELKNAIISLGGNV